MSDEASFFFMLYSDEWVGRRRAAVETAEGSTQTISPHSPEVLDLS
jgi:hypothetical protein